MDGVSRLLSLIIDVRSEMSKLDERTVRFHPNNWKGVLRCAAEDAVNRLHSSGNEAYFVCHSFSKLGKFKLIELLDHIGFISSQ